MHPRNRGVWRAVLGWIAWLGALATLTAGMAALRTHLDRAHVALAYLLLVLAASMRGSRSRGFALALLGFLCFNFFFLPPYSTLVLADPLDGLVLGSFLVVAAVATQLLGRARAEAEEARRRADEIERLSTLGAETLNAGRAEDALRAVAEVIRATLDVDTCEVWLGNGTDAPLALGARAGGGDAATTGDGAVLARLAAEWGEAVLEPVDGDARLVPGRSGRSEVQIPPTTDARGLSLPLQVRGRTAGVLRIARARGIALT
ncbi:MAG TPA: DUF4118 domain-containing protein, partial [Longimicrobium sp.]